MLRTTLALLVLALAGCAPIKPRGPMDAAPVISASGDAVTTSAGPLTARDWNCRGCY